jgi:hypothetical protein
LRAPAEVVQDGGEFVEVGDAGVGVVDRVGRCWEMLGGFPDGFHPHAVAAADVGAEEIADEEGAFGGDFEFIERHLEDFLLRLLVADVGGVEARGEEVEEAFLGEVAVEAIAADEGVGDDAEFEPAVAEVGEHLGGAGGDDGAAANRPVPEPGEIAEFPLVESQAETVEDLFDDAHRIELTPAELGEDVGGADRAVMGVVIASVGGETKAATVEMHVGLLGGFGEEGLVVELAEIDQRVAEIKEHGIKHAEFPGYSVRRRSGYTRAAVRWGVGNGGSWGRVRYWRGCE